MRDEQTLGQAQGQALVQTLVQTLAECGVVYTTASGGELLLELYSLLEALAPDAERLADRLSRVRLVPTRVADLDLYLVYIPLSDVLVHLLPVSTLATTGPVQHWLAATRLTANYTNGHTAPPLLTHVCTQVRVP